MTEKINLSDHWKQSLDKGGKPIMLAHDTPRLETDWLIITPSLASKWDKDNTDKTVWAFKELDDWWSYQFKSDHDSTQTKFAVNVPIRVKLALGNLKMDRNTGLPQHPQKRWQNISEIDREYKPSNAPINTTVEPVEPVQQNSSQDQGTSYWDQKEKDIRGAQGFNLFVEIVTARQAHLLGLSDKVANEILVYNWYRLINNQKIRWDFLSSKTVQDAISRGGVIESVTFPDEIVTEDMEQGW